jgi:RNA polymerase sigma-70 factor (ECF subfamily)
LFFLPFLPGPALSRAAGGLSLHLRSLVHAHVTQELTFCCKFVTFPHSWRLTVRKVDETSESVLVERSAQGDQRAFALLVNRYQGMVFTLACKLLKDQCGAEDAAQDTFLKAYAALPGFQRRAKFSTWLYRICYNTCISQLRRKSPETPIDSVPEPAVSGPVEELNARDVQAALQQEISRLPNDYRAMITLYHLNGLAYDEIARMTAKPMGTVKATIHRARALLRTRLVERVGWDTLKEVMWR